MTQFLSIFLLCLLHVGLLSSGLSPPSPKVAAAVVEKGSHPCLASLFESEEKYTTYPSPPSTPTDFPFGYILWQELCSILCLNPSLGKDGGITVIDLLD